MANAMVEKITQRANSIIPGSPLKEGEFTKTIEEQTAKIPSGGYLSLALGSMALSAGLALFSDRKAFANFVGLWVPTLLIIGLYNKLVKLEGSDAMSKPSKAA